MSKKIKVASLAFMMSISLFANIPPKIHHFKHRQTDGSELIVSSYTDRDRSFYLTDDNKVLLKDDAGNLCYVRKKGENMERLDIVAHSQKEWTSQERLFRKNAVDIQSFLKNAGNDGTVSPQKMVESSIDGLGRYGKSCGGVIPSVGAVTIPFVLVEFSDVSFQEYSTIDKYEGYFNDIDYVNVEGNSGSVGSYFMDQSNGLFTIVFKNIGKIRLSKPRSYYGKNGAQGQTDENRYVFVQEVLDKIVTEGNGVLQENFCVDGVVPNLCIIFAGPGEQSSYTKGSEDYLWAHFSRKTFKSGDVILNSYFVGNELYESYLKDDGSVEYDDLTNQYLIPQSVKTVGIGVICHEMSHALGLPDFYYTGGDSKVYEACETMKYWSPLDYGYFFKDGYAPVGYTAYERSMLGWLNVEELKASQNVSLYSFNNTYENQPNQAYVIRNSQNENEYYILENRQAGKWYPKAMGHGLLITHVDYDEQAWNQNIVNNNPLHQRYEYVPADNKKGIRNLGPADLKGDLYPGTTGNNEFTDNSVPASIVFTNNGKLGKPIYNIKEENGVITFDFFVKDVTSINNMFEKSDTPLELYTIDGRRVNGAETSHGIYIIKEKGLAKKVAY